MIDKLIKILYIIKAQLIFNNVLTHFILCGFMVLFLSYYFIFRTKKKPVSIYDYRLNWWGDFIRIILLYVILYCSIIFYFRIYQTNYVLDLKVVYNNVKYFIIENTLSQIMITVLFWSLFLVILIIFFIFIRNLIKINILKIHFYIVSKYPSKQLFEDTKYDVLMFKVLQFYMSFFDIFRTIVRGLRKLYSIYILKIEYDSLKRYPLESFFSNIQQFNYLFISFFLVLYDTLVNNFVLTKVYYFIPVLVFSGLLQLLVDIICMYETHDAQIIACCLYSKEKALTEDYIIYENGVVIRHEDLYKLIIKINKGTS